MTSILIKEENIASRIYFIRGEKVILDADLSIMYDIETKKLKQAVRRNIDRFPEDFMFELTKEEYDNTLRSQFVTLKRGQHAKYLPFAFTEQGVAMLSSVLRSAKAVEVNIAIMRTFVQLRKLMDSNKELARKIQQLENKYDEQFKVVFQAIKQLVKQETQPRRQIGFNIKKSK